MVAELLIPSETPISGDEEELQLGEWTDGAGDGLEIGLKFWVI